MVKKNIETKHLSLVKARLKCFSAAKTLLILRALFANIHPGSSSCNQSACSIDNRPLVGFYEIYIYIYIDIALWCKNQIEHSIWDESLLLSNCARSLEYSSSSTLAGLSYHISGKLEVAFKASPLSQHIYIHIYIYIYVCVCQTNQQYI